MKMKVTPHTVYRTPIFPISITLEEGWQKLKLLIAESSPIFYRQIADVNESDLTDLPEKLHFTIWKYFNRCRYRSTPFGEFASVSIIDNFQDVHGDIVVYEQQQCHRWLDWTTSEGILHPLHYDFKTHFCRNPSIYKNQGEYRYLYRDVNCFELIAIPSSEDVDQVMSICKHIVSFAEIAELLEEKFNYNEAESRRLVDQLIELQALYLNFLPNITGVDYFERLGFKPNVRVSDYCISSRQHLHGRLSDNYQNCVRDYIEFIAPLLPISKNPTLDKFRIDFVNRWEQQAIPLPLVLDGLLGIGYGSSNFGTDDPFEGALRKQETAEAHFLEMGDFQLFLLNEMIKGKEIHLDNYKGNSNSLPKPKLPNTLSVQLEIYDGKVVICNAGGATANSLLGRFTKLEQFLAYARKLAELEQQANPEVLFFDVAYVFEGKVDNVNRRAHIYEAELCLGSWSTHENSLQMEDILVAVVEDEVVLLHRITRKRLVPRIASAYNYHRSGLAHFRFLSDLQHQGIHSQLTIDLQNFFPRLDWYPRVTFHNCIISPSRWKMPIFDSLSDLYNWLLDKQVVQYLKVGNGDQELVIDTKSETDIFFLYRYQKKQGKAFYVSEALMDSSGTVGGSDGNKYHAQFIVDFQHSEKLYAGFSSVPEPTFQRDLKMPGSEWLYLELYMNPLAMKGFLNNEVRSLIKSQKELIVKWFFIHYNDPQDHLRLRLKLNDPTKLSLLLTYINELVKSGSSYGTLKSMLIKGYEREINRYGNEQMDMIEQFFFLDSSLALLNLRESIELRYALIVDFVQRLSKRLFQDINEQVVFYGQMARLFAEEMKFNRDQFKMINVAYITFSKNLLQHKRKYKSILNLFDKILYQYPKEKQYKLLADLIHLHINRRFSQEQRLHEAILYQYLHKLSLKKWQDKDITS